MGWRTRAFVAFQHLLPKHALTACAHWLARAAWLRRPLIAGFSRLYAIDLSDALEPDPRRYRSFNDFFTRALRSGRGRCHRACARSPVPATARSASAGTIDGNRLLQARLAAKSHWYTLEELLADDPRARDFVGGEFATIYLAPYNYHRVHMPIDGRLTALGYVPGELFSVNRATASAVPQLFARNERVVCRFETAVGPLAVVFVGALNVGSIAVVGFGDLTPARPRAARGVELPPGAPVFVRGAELGRFNMGSTVILLLPRGRCRWAADFVPGAAVRVGAPIGELTTAPP